MTTRMRRRLARLGFVTTLGAAVAVALSAVAFPTPGAHDRLFVAPDGGDGAPCTRQFPCRTLEDAFRLADPGAVIELAAGTYPRDSISGEKAAGRDVVIRPAPGAAVTVRGLAIQGTSRVRVEDLNLQSDLAAGLQDALRIDACTHDITFDGVRGDRFLILEGTSSIAFRGGSWGGYSEPGHQDSAIGTSGSEGPTRQCDGKLAGPAHDISFRKVTFSDVFWNIPRERWGGAHPDCFEINGYVDGLTISDSTFRRCGDSFFAIYAAQGDVVNVLVENSTFEDLGDYAWYGMQFTNESWPHGCGNIVFRHNVYRPNNPHGVEPYAPLLTECKAPSGGMLVAITDNTFQRGPKEFNCSKYRAAPFYTLWDGNRFEVSDACGTDAKLLKKG